MKSLLMILIGMEIGILTFLLVQGLYFVAGVIAGFLTIAVAIVVAGEPKKW